MTSFQRDMQRKQQQKPKFIREMPKHEQQRQTATGVDDRYNGGAGASVILTLSRVSVDTHNR